MYFTESNQRRSDKTQNEKEATINLTNKQKKRIQSNLIWFISPKKKRKIDEKKNRKKPQQIQKNKKQKKKRN